MAEDVIFKCDFIEITCDGQDYYIQSFKTGFTLDDFNKLISQNPQIRISSFSTVKNSIISAPKAKEKFGEMKERVQIEISPDGLKAFLILGIPSSELGYSNREALKREIMQKINEAGVVSGIKQDVLLYQLENEKKYLIAEGIPPENGKDAVIKIYQIKEAKPRIAEEKNVDHYDLSLINRVAKDEWLGERIASTPGNPGKSVLGKEIPPVPGKNLLLYYDKNSVYEVQDGNKTTIHSLYNGAVSYNNGQVTVSNHLEIAKNVDFSTGNINFDGCVTIKGTVDDNFMVQADGDIEILGELGVGNVRGIISRNGSVFIKGGISSKSRVEIKAARNIFVKYASNVRLIAGNMVNIGYYCINSEIITQEVIVDSSKGQIIGGTIEADARVVANILGSVSEKRTFVRIRGINKDIIVKKLEDINSLIEEDKNQIIKCKNELNSAAAAKAPQAKIIMLKEKIVELVKAVKLKDEEKKSLGGLLKVKGCGEIVIQKKIFPNCRIEIKNLSMEITKEQSGVTFYMIEGEIKKA